MKRLLGARSICLDVLGEDFSKVPETYVIFITETDIYKKGLPFYTTERMNTLLDTSFADGEHILYVNGSYRGEDAIGKLMHDFTCSNPDDMIDRDIANIARYYKETEEGVQEMCKAMEDMRNEAATRARLENARQIALNLIVLGELSFEKIAKVTNLSIEEVKNLAESKSA